MPLYQYQCQSCQHEWDELWGSFKEAEELEGQLKCPECQATGAKRLLGSPVTQFKGGGWTPRSGNDRSYDSSAGIKEHTKAIAEEAKKLKSSDLYPDLPKPKDIG